MKRFKTKSIFLLVLMVCVCCSSCKLFQEERTVTGIDHFHSVSNHYDVDLYLLPTEDYITRFISQEADYYYYSKTWAKEKSFIYFRYDADEFEKAYEYALENMHFLSQYTFAVNGYSFLLQDIHVRNPNMSPSEYPNWFWMMFYSRENKTIGFLGFYRSPSTQIVEPYEDFRGFLETEFPGFEW